MTKTEELEIVENILVVIDACKEYNQHDVLLHHSTYETLRRALTTYKLLFQNLGLKIDDLEDR